MHIDNGVQVVTHGTRFADIDVMHPFRFKDTPEDQALAAVIVGAIRENDRSRVAPTGADLKRQQVKATKAKQPPLFEEKEGTP